MLRHIQHLPLDHVYELGRSVCYLLNFATRKHTEMRYLPLFILLLISGSADLFGQLKNFTTRKSFSHADKVTALTFTPNGKKFVTAHENGLVLVRDAQSKKLTHTFRGHTDDVRQISFHPNNRYFATASDDGSVKVWDLVQDTLIFDSHTILPSAVRPEYFSFAFFDTGGKQIYYGGSDGKIYTVNVIEGGALEIYKDYGRNIFDADIDYIHNRLALVEGRFLRIIDLNTGMELRKILSCNGHFVQDVKFNYTGANVATICRDGQLQLWDVDTTAKLNEFEATQRGPSTEIDFFPMGELLTGHVMTKAIIYRPSTGQVMQNLSGEHTTPVTKVDVSLDGTQLLTADEDQVKLWTMDIPPPAEIIEEKKEETAETPAPPVPPTPHTPPTPPVVKKKKPQQAELESAPEPAPKPEPEIVDPRNLEGFKLTYNTRNLPDSLGDRSVKTGKKVVVNADDIEIFVWDSEYEDGDTISLFLNGEWLLKEYALRNKKKKIRFSLDPNGDNYLILHAHNEGERPPNTAAVSINDGRRTKRISLSSDLDNSDAVKFSIAGTKED